MQTSITKAPSGTQVGPPGRTTGPRRLIAFASGSVNYAFQLACAREVQAWAGAHPLPCTPLHVRGIINLRGQIVPVIDLRARLSSVLTDAGEEHVVVIIVINQERFGVLVDRIHGIVNVRAEDISPPPTLGDSSLETLFTGIVRDGERLIGILDASRIVGKT